MDWTGVVAVALGGAIGVGSTLATDRVRWRRDSVAQDRETLRAVYVQYLEALAQARDVISHASREVHRSAEERAQMAWTVTRDHGVYARQYALELIAPVEVVERTKGVADRLVTYRDAVVQGETWRDAGCTEARRALREARHALMDAMRATLARPQ
ncbi:hypothetical protein ACFYRC_37230 [Streptomyces sp. NPDC005279]|uniref:hypothetical protein n=1 Tax=Streptomyces sp. NPDC005279 TaxID=3364712 RepID=UPI0036738691